MEGGPEIYKSIVSDALKDMGVSKSKVVVDDESKPSFCRILACKIDKIFDDKEFLESLKYQIASSTKNSESVEIRYFSEMQGRSSEKVVGRIARKKD